VAERISGIYNRLYNGASAYFVDDLSRLYEYMLDVKPTVFASLPRFFEKIHASIVAKHGTAKVDPQIVKDAFGGRIRLLTSGGAPLPPRSHSFLPTRAYRYFKPTDSPRTSASPSIEPTISNSAPSETDADV
jgi:long-subunit acyl-CoA synthetase (AMP-forming)